ncbi:hypothetical protein L596_020297 [Steinernema carpocapsae]|uniref:Uncharacterized protein n=1 Tax=Steinernema carpocapsae TaxID=34508 RepID=A0A4U5MTW8_STECR|nr:hypothetical protein L596_020297 [Steinernema carpocapsae]
MFLLWLSSSSPKTSFINQEITANPGQIALALGCTSDRFGFTFAAMKVVVLLLIFSCLLVHSKSIKDDEDDSAEQEESKPMSKNEKDYYNFLLKRLKQQSRKRNPVAPAPYQIPGPFEPLPGRSHNGDYWPVFPFANQYSGGVDLDPSISRHIGGDINIPVPTWGMLDITGRFFNRTSDTTTKFGYMNHPVNMLGLSKEDFTKLMSDPSLHHNRNIQPVLPLGKVPRSNVGLSCRPPMCNPYTQTFQFGMEHDIGGYDGVDGDINVPIPIGKDLAYRFPIGGNLYWDLDNVTVSYGHNLAPVDPYVNPVMFGIPNHDAFFKGNDWLGGILPPERRHKRSVMGKPGMMFPGQIPYMQSYPMGAFMPQMAVPPSESGIQYPGQMPYSYVQALPTTAYMPQTASVPASFWQEPQFYYSQPGPQKFYSPQKPRMVLYRPVNPYMATVSQPVSPNLMYVRRRSVPYPFMAPQQPMTYIQPPYIPYLMPADCMEPNMMPNMYPTRRVPQRFMRAPVMYRRPMQTANPALTQIIMEAQKNKMSKSTPVKQEDFTHPLMKRVKRFHSIFRKNRK